MQRLAKIAIVLLGLVGCTERRSPGEQPQSGEAYSDCNDDLPCMEGLGCALLCSEEQRCPSGMTCVSHDVHNDMTGERVETVEYCA